MLKEFNELPLEMQSNILRFNPNMRRLNLYIIIIK